MVRFRLLAVLALVGAAGGVPSARAHSDPPVGRACGFNSVTDVTVEAGHQVGQVNGGPLAHTEPGQITCSIHVNNHTHAGAAAVRRSGSTDLVSVLVPTPIFYGATAADTVAVCTEYQTGPDTWFWTAESSRPGGGVWTTDAAAPCSVFGPADVNGDVCPVLLTIDGRAGTGFAETWQDCEPYEPIV